VGIEIGVVEGKLLIVGVVDDVDWLNGAEFEGVPKPGVKTFIQLASR
jgi:hypothetical protein